MADKRLFRTGAVCTAFVLVAATADIPIETSQITWGREFIGEDKSPSMSSLALTSGVTTILSKYLMETDIVSLMPENEPEETVAELVLLTETVQEPEPIQEAAGLIQEETAAEPVDEETEETENGIRGTIAAAKVNDYVNVRKGAGEDYEVIGKLHKGCVAKLLREKEGWYKIKSGNCKGYIKAEYLSLDEADVAAAGERVAVVDADKLRVRREASASAKIKCLVPNGEELTVIDETDDEWIEVDLEGGSGFVAADYVTLKTNYRYAETVEEEQARLQKEREEKEAARKAAEEAAKKAESRKSTASGSSASSGRSYTAPSGSDGSAVASYASQFVGNPYVYGGSSLTNGTDCSGFVMSVYAAFGVSLPHSSSRLRSSGYGVELSEIQPGDIVCYSGHVGIYVGNDTIVHASTRSTGIKFTSPVNYRTVLAVRRIF